jgi:hypothetical protein
MRMVTKVCKGQSWSFLSFVPIFAPFPVRRNPIWHSGNVKFAILDGETKKPPLPSGQPHCEYTF